MLLLTLVLEGLLFPLPEFPLTLLLLMRLFPLLLPDNV